MKFISFVLLLTLVSFSTFARPMSEMDLDNQARMRRQELEQQMPQQIQAPQPQVQTPQQQVQVLQPQEQTLEQRIQALEQQAQQQILVLEQRIQVLEREVHTAIQDALVFEKRALSFERDALTFEQEVRTVIQEAMAFERDALAFEQRALAFEQRTLAFEQRALAFEREALTFEQNVRTVIQEALDFERDALAFEQRALAFEQETLDFEQRVLAFGQRALDFEQDALAFEQEAWIAIQQALTSAQRALAATQPEQLPVQPVQPVSVPVQPSALVSKSLTITGITDELADRGSFGLLVGAFPRGTNMDFVINDLAVYLNYLGYLSGNEAIQRVIAAADPTDPMSGASIWGSINNYAGNAPLYVLYGDDFVNWTGSGTYDVWVALTDGYTGYLYQARDIPFITATTTVPASGFSLIYSEDISSYIAAAPYSPAPVYSPDPKSLTITGITDELADQGSFGLLVGVFPNGTSQDFVLNDLSVYLNYLGFLWGNETIQRVVAAADPTDPMSGASIWGTLNNYSGNAPLYILSGDDFINWTGSGTYDVWVALTNGYTGYLYQARDIPFTTATTTVPASGFSIRHSQLITQYVPPPLPQQQVQVPVQQAPQQPQQTQQQVQAAQELQTLQQQVQTLERDVLAFERDILAFGQELRTAIQQTPGLDQQALANTQQALILAQQALAAAQQALAQQLQPPAQQVITPALVPKSLTITGITDQLADQGSFGLLVGAFPNGTSQDFVLNDLAVYLNYLGYLSGNETIQRVIAAADPTDPMSGTTVWGTINNYAGNAPLYILFGNDFYNWTGSGTYDVWVALTDGFTGYLYQARGISFTSAATIVPAANFSLSLSQRIY